MGGGSTGMASVTDYNFTISAGVSTTIVATSNPSFITHRFAVFKSMSSSSGYKYTPLEVVPTTNTNIVVSIGEPVKTGDTVTGVITVYDSINQVIMPSIPPNGAFFNFESYASGTQWFCPRTSNWKNIVLNQGANEERRTSDTGGFNGRGYKVYNNGTYSTLLITDKNYLKGYPSVSWYAGHGLSTTFTIWIKFNGHNSPYDGIMQLSAHLLNDAAYTVLLYNPSTKKFGVYASELDQTYWATNTTELATGVWYFIGFARSQYDDHDAITYYVYYAPESANSVIQVIACNPTPTLLAKRSVPYKSTTEGGCIGYGYYPNTSYYSNAIIDNVRIYYGYSLDYNHYTQIFTLDKLMH